MAAKLRMVETRNNFFMDDSFSKHSTVQARIGSLSPHAKIILPRDHRRAPYALRACDFGVRSAAIERRPGKVEDRTQRRRSRPRSSERAIYGGATSTLRTLQKHLNTVEQRQ